MAISAWKLLIIALVVLVLFGRGRIAETMGDFGKGIRNFKKGMEDEDGKSAAELPRPQAEVLAADKAAPDRAS